MDTTTPIEPPYWRDPAWWAGLRRAAFGRSFWIFLGVASGLGLMCLAVEGPAATWETLVREIGMLIGLVPQVLLALAVAAVIWAVLPKNRLAQHVGEDSGLRGLAIAATGGAITPGGPTSAYGLLSMLSRAGADRGALVAYIVAWSVLGVQRILIWDVPFMGAEFAILRALISLPLPIIAGLIARHYLSAPEPGE
jgi:uncharacterized membrane protein YraQ (UPF0718 family)